MVMVASAPTMAGRQRPNRESGWNPEQYPLLCVPQMDCRKLPLALTAGKALQSGTSQKTCHRFFRVLSVEGKARLWNCLRGYGRFSINKLSVY